MDNSSIITFISSAAFAAIISGIVATIMNNKNMSLRYITKERAAWRKEIKDLTSKICSGQLEDKQLRESVTKLILNLNPLDETGLDFKIISLLESIEEGNYDENTLKKLRECVGVLLKHDWERSKNETRPFLLKDTNEKIISQTIDKYNERCNERRE